MSSLAISAIVFGCVAGSALLGMVLRRVLPERHLSPDSKEVVKLGLGLIGTMAALVLGLMVSSAKSSYDAQQNHLLQMSVKVILLDRVLAHYGKEAKPTRDAIRAGLAKVLAEIWPEDRSQAAQLDPTAAKVEGIYDLIQGLSPKDDAQRAYLAEAMHLAFEIGQLRWTLFQESGSAISTPFLLVLAFWLCVIFAGFGMMAPPNATTTATLVLCALAVAGALFLILELNRPFDGMIQISSAPLRNALNQMGR
jgi:hypothetical protein